MQTITLDEAQKHLAELVQRLSFEGELLIVDAEKPIARITPVTARPSLYNLQPSSVGNILIPFPAPDANLLDEMLPSSQ